MATARIPADLFNPGQVLASLGLLEAAMTLLGHADARFDWTDPAATAFELSTPGDECPVDSVLSFLAGSGVAQLVPRSGVSRVVDGSAAEDRESVAPDDEGKIRSATTDAFPAGVPERMALPVRLSDSRGRMLEVTHWADGSSRDTFKLYSGNRSAAGIAQTMLRGLHRTPRRGQDASVMLQAGLCDLFEKDRPALTADPFNQLVPIGGSFNMDPRGAWTAIDMGYSPNDQGHDVIASPVVEMLATIGLEHARPAELQGRRICYGVWGRGLPPMLARAALATALPGIPQRFFEFTLSTAGKNKVVTFSREVRPP